MTKVPGFPSSLYSCCFCPVSRRREGKMMISIVIAHQKSLFLFIVISLRLWQGGEVNLSSVYYFLLETRFWSFLVLSETICLCYNFFLCDSHLLVLMLNCYFFQCFALNYVLLSFYNVYFIFDPRSGYFKFSNILKLVFFFVSIYHSMTCNVFSSFCLRKCFNS